MGLPAQRLSAVRYSPMDNLAARVLGRDVATTRAKFAERRPETPPRLASVFDFSFTNRDRFELGDDGGVGEAAPPPLVE
jgi:hypothetical protein